MFPPRSRFALIARAVMVLSLFACRAVIAAAPLDEAYLAVVQIPSHGASGTIVYTAAGQTLVLTVAHAFEGPARNRPLVVFVPKPEGAGTEKKVGIRLIALDERADLALIRL